MEDTGNPHYADKTETRYVVTHVEERHGTRVLTFGCQGRNTYATMTEAALALLEWNTPHGLQRALTPDELTTLEVRPVLCWTGHHDPVRSVFEH